MNAGAPILYFAVGVLTLACSRKTIKNSRGFRAIGESYLCLILWPLVWIVRLAICVIEGNMWEELE